MQIIGLSVEDSLYDSCYTSVSLVADSRVYLTVTPPRHLYQNFEFNQNLHSHILEWILLGHYL